MLFRSYELRTPLAEGLTRLLDWYRGLGIPPERLLEDEVVRNWDVAPR